MRGLESEYQVIEMLHATKIFVETAKRLTPEDIDALEEIADLIKGSKPQEPCEMAVSKIEKALGHPIKIIKRHSNGKM